MRTININTTMDSVITKRQDYIFAMLPEWLREAYNNDPIVNQAVKLALHGGAGSAAEVGMRVAQALYSAHSELKRIHLDHMKRSPSVIVPSTGKED